MSSHLTERWIGTLGSRQGLGRTFEQRIDVHPDDVEDPGGPARARSGRSRETRFRSKPTSLTAKNSSGRSSPSPLRRRLLSLLPRCCIPHLTVLEAQLREASNVELRGLVAELRQQRTGLSAKGHTRWRTYATAGSQLLAVGFARPPGMLLQPFATAQQQRPFAGASLGSCVMELDANAKQISGSVISLQLCWTRTSVKKDREIARRVPDRTEPFQK